MSYLTCLLVRNILVPSRRLLSVITTDAMAGMEYRVQCPSQAPFSVFDVDKHVHELRQRDRSNQAWWFV